MVYSIVANQRQPQYTYSVLQPRCQQRPTIIYIKGGSEGGRGVEEGKPTSRKGGGRGAMRNESQLAMRKENQLLAVCTVYNVFANRYIERSGGGEGMLSKAVEAISMHILYESANRI